MKKVELYDTNVAFKGRVGAAQRACFLDLNDDACRRRTSSSSCSTFASLPGSAHLVMTEPFKLLDVHDLPPKLQAGV